MHRVRQARHRFLADKLGQRDYQKLSTVRLKKELLRRNLLGRMRSAPLFQGLIDGVSQFPEGVEKFALILQQESKQLALFDRYENRARRRRNRAIRSLDEARLLKTKVTIRRRPQASYLSPSERLSSVGSSLYILIRSIR